ncbi:unnamed protein product [Cunninghamella echinulata]
MSLLFIVQQAYAQGTCPAEANYQGCKQIEQDKLSKCSPVDYTCQCEAQKLIQQCFNLCPNYTSEATIHDSVVQSICSAVPAPSSTTLSLSTVPSSSSTSSLINTSTSPSPSSNQPSHANILMVSSYPFFFFLSLHI